MTTNTSIFTITADTALSAAQRQSQSLGVPLPKPLTQALDELDALYRRMPELHVADLGALARALLDALAGKGARNPYADPKVTTQALKVALTGAGLPAALDREIERRRAEVVAQHAPAIIESWRGPLEEAGRTIAEARRAMPGVSFRDTAAVASLPAGQMTLWGRARDAVTTTGSIATSWGLLVSGSGLAQGPFTKALIVADLDAETADKIGDAEAVADAGHRLTLATVDGYRHRVRRVQRERAARAVAEQAPDKGNAPSTDRAVATR